MSDIAIGSELASLKSLIEKVEATLFSYGIRLDVLEQDVDNLVTDLIIVPSEDLDPPCHDS